MEQETKELIIYLLLHENMDFAVVAKRFRLSEDELRKQIVKINHLLQQEKNFYK
ncbi:hypothetical protein MCOL2_03816 [Listeria fleischmannii FSL S10-1203]|uniref:Uncharacterized protein n=1 Tax=Listeria fleischmannii FSL S10-1203 TaxID=1265822 RepID=W7DHQ6_9LIST|nr:hypothetical protein [Listeria fleischmannii]EUJ61556.1 hypothetical protein MCOL2_03816 [Listeria fleischmannii FSL S10-1203]